MVARFAVGLGALIGAITLGSVRPDATTNLHSDSNEGSPGPKVLALVSIEQSLSIASLLWLDILQHVGQGSSLSKNVLRDVANLAFWAVDLDSRRFNFYHVPAILAATSGFPKLSDSLCERGVRNLPGRSSSTSCSAGTTTSSVAFPTRQRTIGRGRLKWTERPTISLA